jgi:hypothetical protein
MQPQRRVKPILKQITPFLPATTPSVYDKALGVFQNMALRNILGPKWHEVTGDWRRQHNEEVHELY